MDVGHVQSENQTFSRARRRHQLGGQGCQACEHRVKAYIRLCVFCQWGARLSHPQRCLCGTWGLVRAFVIFASANADNSLTVGGDGSLQATWSAGGVKLKSDVGMISWLPVYACTLASWLPCLVAALPRSCFPCFPFAASPAWLLLSCSFLSTSCVYVCLAPPSMSHGCPFMPACLLPGCLASLQRCLVHVSLAFLWLLRPLGCC